jgi:hypothetical protein
MVLESLECGGHPFSGLVSQSRLQQHVFDEDVARRKNNPRPSPPDKYCDQTRQDAQEPVDNSTSVRYCRSSTMVEWFQYMVTDNH